MSNYCSGAGHVVFKERPTDEKLNEIKKSLRMDTSITDNTFSFCFAGNWWIDDVTALFDEDLIIEGEVELDGDETGLMRSVFKDGEWVEDAAEHYYHSDLPTKDLFPTERASRIINVLIGSLLGHGCGIDRLRRLMRSLCKITDKEIELLNLGELFDDDE